MRPGATTAHARKHRKRIANLFLLALLSFFGSPSGSSPSSVMLAASASFPGAKRFKPQQDRVITIESADFRGIPFFQKFVEAHGDPTAGIVSHELCG